jgi:hypothetical protein
MRMLDSLFRGHIISNKYNRGLYVTICNIMRIGFITMTQDSTNIDISISIWKFGLHIHVVKAKENICQDKNNHKNQ